MIILNLGDLLQANLGAPIASTNVLTTYTCWQVATIPAAPPYIYGTTGTNTTLLGPTTVPIIPNPHTGEQFQVLEITIFNTDTSPAQVTISILVFSAPLSPTVILYNCVLAAGETLSYNATPGESGTWTIFDTSGNAR